MGASSPGVSHGYGAHPGRAGSYAASGLSAVVVAVVDAALGSVLVAPVCVGSDVLELAAGGAP